MAKPRKGVMPPALKAYWAKQFSGGGGGHKKSRRSSNPPSKKHGTKRRRRNPGGGRGFLGLPVSGKELLAGGGSVIAQPLAENLGLSLLPASIAGTWYGRWGVRLATAYGVSWLADALMGREGQNASLIALGSVLTADAVAEFTRPAGVSGYQLVNRPGMRGYLTARRPGLSGGLVIPGNVVAAQNARTGAAMLGMQQLPFRSGTGMGTAPSPFRPNF